jgi:hypothetical protein
MRKRMLLATFAVVGMLALSSAVSAQDVIVEGLNDPRHMAVGPNGELYIAESGTGGDIAVEGVFGPAVAGDTAQITLIAPDGTRSVPVFGLPSRDEGGQIAGASGLLVADGLLWVALSQGTLLTPLSYGVVALDIDNRYRVRHFIDVYAAEAELNPDGGEIDSNPVDLAWDGTNRVLYIADAGCNCVWSWTEDGGLGLFTSWSVDQNPVPTSVALAPESLYVGFLTGFPFPTGGATVEQYSLDGTLTQTYEGFTAVVDLLFANDTLYAVEMAQFGDRGWTPDTGRVVDVLSGEAYAEGLNLPYGLVMTENGLLVTVNSAYLGAGAGSIVSLGM